MPLIIITGTPCSGKTFRAQQILQDFKHRIEGSQIEPKRTVIHLPSHHASLDPPLTIDNSFSPPGQSINPRDNIYLAARQEKTARAEEFSAVKRALGKNAIVIADAPNYIKGFRYQLFCEAKAVGTTSVVLHTAAREDECITWNNARLEAWHWRIESEEEATEDKNVAQISGPKVGKDILGDLDPESHTAIYGDKVINEGTRSRSSSTGAAVSDDEVDVPSNPHHKADDTMTLKSLYITDRVNDTNFERPSSHETVEVSGSSETQEHLSPTSTPPSPRSSLPYSSLTLKSLHMRYEPPSPFTRWDTPLFTIPSTDPHPPYSQIWAALFPTPSRPPSKKALAAQKSQSQSPTKSSNPSMPSTTPQAQAQAQPPTPLIRPNAATILPTSHAPNALQTLESTTGDIVKLLLSAARSTDIANGSGGTLTFTLPIPESSETLELSIEIPEGLVLSQPLLQRARRKYTQIQRGGIAHGQGYVAGRDGRRGVAEGFVRFLEGEWGVDG